MQEGGKLTSKIRLKMPYIGDANYARYTNPVSYLEQIQHERKDRRGIITYSNPKPNITTRPAFTPIGI
jgi:hypothetical protein